MIQNSEIQNAVVWVICAKCNGAKHLVLKGEQTPYWWCQDERYYLREGQEIELEEV